MTSKQKPVVCLGILVADVVGRPLLNVPDPGRLVLVEEMGLYTGGCAVNAATALANLGIPVEVIGMVGADPFGDFVVSAMQDRGIGTRGVRRDPQAGTSATMVMVDPDGERRFVHYIGANAHLTIKDVDLQLVKEAAILHIGGSLVLPGLDGAPTAELLQQARAAGVTTFLDTVWDDTGRWMTLLEPSLPYIDYFIPSLPEAQAIVDLDEPAEVAQALLAHGAGTVALKMGANGCLVMSANGESIRLPAFDVEVVDATGAGDAFAAGFMAGVWQDWSLERTAQFASAVGALCVTGIGAAGGVRSLAETIQFMETAQVKV
jgi:sugar/nucleoside kinase (ribokinase family)